MATKVTGFRIQDGLKAELSEWAEKEDRNLSQLITRILRNAVEQRRHEVVSQ